ncbi:MAG: sugar phosphate isomerase/epimerase [Chloroflexi bacterium]|nr:sugar phosphate isomerase/epimerase [Chloroflexota bacterium]
MTYYVTVTHIPGTPLLSFSTLACPEWSPLEVVTRAADMGFGGIEWRGGPDGHAGPHLAPVDRLAVRRAMDERGLVAVSVTTYTDFVHPDEAVRAASVTELVEHAAVAVALGAPLLRAFLGERSDDAPLSELLDRAAAGLLAAEAAIAGSGVAIAGSGVAIAGSGVAIAGSGVAIAIEPHDDFLASSIMASLLERIGGPGIGVIWDAGNTWSLGERPETGLDLLRPWLRYIQIKDGTGLLPDWHLTPIGEGEVPIADAFAWLAKSGLALPVSIEWERPWHPELPPASVALPAGLAHLQSLVDVTYPGAQEGP